jgi:hypothetical protein
MKAMTKVDKWTLNESHNSQGQLKPAQLTLLTTINYMNNGQQAGIGGLQTKS